MSNMTRWTVMTVLLNGLAFTVFATQYTFTTLDNPAAIPGITYALGINDAGQIAGYYYDGAGAHGFLYNAGIYTPLDDPLATGGTVALGINNAGQIVGYYVDGGGHHGFLYSGGTFTTIDDPLTAYNGNSGYYNSANGINDSGQIVGYYCDASAKCHGYLYTSGAFTTLDDPASTLTSATGINSLGQVVGYWELPGGSHGFLYTGGTFTTVDDPLTVQPGGTGASGINTAGQIVGSYFDGSVSHGYVDNGGTFSTIDEPLATGGTIPFGINSSGQLTGYYTDGGGVHGFVATPTNVYAAAIQQPINPDGSSVFNAKRGVVPAKFTLTSNGVPTCQLPPATVALTRTSGSTPGSIDESVYLLQSDTGSNFRIDNCQYVYNLATGSLGPGIYVVQIKINGNVVGSGTFGLQ